MPSSTAKKASSTVTRRRIIWNFTLCSLSDLRDYLSASQPHRSMSAVSCVDRRRAVHDLVMQAMWDEEAVAATVEVNLRRSNSGVLWTRRVLQTCPFTGGTRCRDRPAGSLARVAVGDGGDGVDCGEAVTAVSTRPAPAPVHGPGALAFGYGSGLAGVRRGVLGVR